MAIQLKAFYRFNIIPTKFQMAFFTGIERDNPTIYLEVQRIVDNHEKECCWGGWKVGLVGKSTLPQY